MLRCKEKVGNVWNKNIEQLKMEHRNITFIRVSKEEHWHCKKSYQWCWSKDKVLPDFRGNDQKKLK